jgi:hypothetical protein
MAGGNTSNGSGNAVAGHGPVDDRVDELGAVAEQLDEVGPFLNRNMGGHRVDGRKLCFQYPCGNPGKEGVTIHFAP